MRPTSRELNGSRPARLKINKESHSIQKSSASNSSSSSSSTATSSIIDHRDPVIIYTHSPKIIHTEARDFMALVQKLTGLSPNPNDNAAAATKCGMMPPPQSNIIAFDDNYNPSVDLQVTSSSISSNSLSLTDSSSPDPPNATTMTTSTSIMAPEAGLSDNIPGLKPDSADFFFPESPNCFMSYQEMSEISPSMANGWIQPVFGYGDHENLF